MAAGPTPPGDVIQRALEFWLRGAARLVDLNEGCETGIGGVMCDPPTESYVECQFYSGGERKNGKCPYFLKRTNGR